MSDLKTLDLSNVTSNSVIFYDKRELTMEQVRGLFKGMPDGLKNVVAIPVNGPVSDGMLAIVSDGNAAVGLGMLKGAMRHHPDFAWTWHCNIACAAIDEGVDHETANKIAARFMKAAFDAEGYQP